MLGDPGPRGRAQIESKVHPVGFKCPLKNSRAAAAQHEKIRQFTVGKVIETRGVSVRGHHEMSPDIWVGVQERETRAVAEKDKIFLVPDSPTFGTSSPHLLTEDAALTLRPAEVLGPPRGPEMFWNARILGPPS